MREKKVEVLHCHVVENHCTVSWPRRCCSDAGWVCAMLAGCTDAGWVYRCWLGVRMLAAFSTRSRFIMMRLRNKNLCYRYQYDMFPNNSSLTVNVLHAGPVQFII
jgi:hypothetical protein